jgi:Glycosyl transferases group 1
VRGRAFDRTRDRVLVAAPNAREWDLARYVSESLTHLGVSHDVLDWSRCPGDSLDALLVERVRKLTPRVLLVLKLDGPSLRALAEVRALDALVALWQVDCFTPDIPPRAALLAAEADLVLTTARGMVQAYARLVRGSAHWVYEGVHLPAFLDFELEEGQRRLFGSEVAFVGNVYQPPEGTPNAGRRLRLLTRVAERYDLKVWGLQSKSFDAREPPPFRVVRWPAYNADCVRVCRASNLVLGMNTVDNVELYFSNRTFLTLASGGFHLTSYVLGLERMFENHRHLVWFHSDDECLELLTHYLARPHERARIAAEGRQLVRARDALANRVARILDLAEAHDADPSDR